MTLGCTKWLLPDAAVDPLRFAPTLILPAVNIVNAIVTPGAILRMSSTNRLRFALVDLMNCLLAVRLYHKIAPGVEVLFLCTLTACTAFYSLFYRTLQAEGVQLMQGKKCPADGLPKAAALEAPTAFFLTAATKLLSESSHLVTPTVHRAARESCGKFLLHHYSNFKIINLLLSRT